MKKIRVILLIGLLLLVVVSCEKVIFSDLGDVQHKEIEYDYFSEISIYNTFDVEVKSDTAFSIELEAYGDYIENIIIELDSNNLKISDENELKWMTGYPRPKVRITFPRLDDKIFFEYPINIYSIDTLHLPRLVVLSLGKTADLDLLLDVDYFQLATGSDNYGSYTIKGNAEYSYLWTRGSSRFEASALHTKSCVVKSNSIIDCWVNVSERLEAQLNTSGNIFYSGNPDEIVLLEESGSGKLISTEN
jgi:hypothetical protein